MTKYETVFNSFRNIIIRDSSLFDAQEDMLNNRLIHLLRHAITKIVGTRDNKDLPINFYSLKDDDLMVFNEDLNDMEVDLLAYFMYQCYLEEMTISKINALKTVGFSDDEIKSFSSSEILDKYMKALSRVEISNENLLKQYKRLDRDTLKYKRFNYMFE